MFQAGYPTGKTESTVPENIETRGIEPQTRIDFIKIGNDLLIEWSVNNVGSFEYDCYVVKILGTVIGTVPRNSGNTFLVKNVDSQSRKTYSVDACRTETGIPPAGNIVFHVGSFTYPLNSSGGGSGGDDGNPPEPDVEVPEEPTPVD